MAPKTIIAVDNCYGEFVSDSEPIESGADICAGSMIKNPGGGIAPEFYRTNYIVRWTVIVRQSFVSKFFIDGSEQ